MGKFPGMAALCSGTIVGGEKPAADPDGTGGSVGGGAPEDSGSAALAASLTLSLSPCFLRISPLLHW